MTQHTSTRRRSGATSDTVVTGTLDSPIGTLTLVASARGLRALWWDDDPRPPTPDAGAVAEGPPAAHDVLAAASQQLREYFDGTRTEFDLPLDPDGTPFQHAAWAALRTIPYGSTWTYGAQARALGDPNKARAVGAANGRNPIGIVVPCHRVVGADGSLTGFAGGLKTKAWLLDHERRVLAMGAAPS
jgi:methylated-DNA-[protein]-cysteine S-methyltransferase